MRAIVAPKDVARLPANAMLAAQWEVALSRKIIEISGTAGTARQSCAVDLLLQAQRRGETVAWIQPENGGLYPPDLHLAGVDLPSLVVVHVPRRVGVYGIPRAAELLLGSGAYGLVVLDLLAGEPQRREAWQSRLLSSCRAHRCIAVVLTQKGPHAESLGPWASWRLQPTRHRQLREGLFLIEPEVLKNKAGQVWPQTVLRRCGPPGVL